MPEYAASEEALRSAALLHQSVNDLQAQQNEDRIILTAGKKEKCAGSGYAGTGKRHAHGSRRTNSAGNTKSITPLLLNPNPEVYDRFVEPDEISRQGLYVYRLVDKDNVYAVYSESYADFAQAEEARKRMAAWLRLHAVSTTDAVKKVKYRSQEFFGLFPCEEGTAIPPCHCSPNNEEEYVYYFSVPVDEANSATWRSLQHYTTEEAARKDFLFFLILLKFGGNLFVDCDNCNNDGKRSWRIYIRKYWPKVRAGL